MSIKSLALAIKSTAFASATMLTVILDVAVVTAPGTGRLTGLLSPGGGRRLGLPSSTARRAGPPYQRERSRYHTSLPGASPAPAGAHTVVDDRTFQLG
jgi:hypothetical protein